MIRNLFSLVVALLVLATACAADPMLTPTLLPPPATATSTPTALPTAAFTAVSLKTPTRTITATLAPSATPSLTVAPVAAVSGEATHGTDLFHQYTCDSCHDVSQPSPGGFYAPNLGNISEEAAQVMQLPKYTGSAKDVPSYIRESVLTPNVYIVPGDLYMDAPGVSAMDQDFAERISTADLNDLISYLLTLDAKPIGDPVNGQKLFAVNLCDSCHDVSRPAPGGEYGPNLGSVSVAAQQVLTARDYHGSAKTVTDYIRESILMPNVYLVPGKDYIAVPGESVMPQDFATTITAQDVNDLIAYLLSIKIK